MVFLFSALATLVVSGVTIQSMTTTVENLSTAKENMDTTKNILINNYELRLRATAVAAEKLLTTEDLDKLHIRPGSPGSPAAWFNNGAFLVMRERLARFGREYDLAYVYFYSRIDNYLQPLIDNDPDAFKAYTPVSELITIDEDARDAWNGKEVVISEGEYFTDADGLITAYAPILDGAGEVIAIVGVDIKDEQVYRLSAQIEFLSGQTEYLGGRITFLIAGMISALALLIFGGALTFIVTRRRADDLDRALTHAREASRAKGVFLANMSHEMRTPLNAVIGMTAIAKKETDPERKEYCLGKIEEASTHLLGVINDVLDYSKIEAAKFELVQAEFDFEMMLGKVCDVIAFKVAEKNQDFNVAVDEGIPRRLVGDEQHIAQVITNFLSNAVKFTQDNGAISLNAHLDGERDGRLLIRVEVMDNGIGISDEQKERLFRSFEQADNTITKRFGGTGLGLAISKHIVEMMDGEVTMESEIGKGSTFGFIIPFERAAEREEDAPACVVEEGAGDEESCDDFSGRCLLLVDDVDINREIVAILLKPTNITVDCAENGAEALQMFTENPKRYDIILMDVQMPEMDGYEATRRIRALKTPYAETVTIIAMTANVFHDDIARALEAGMDAHIGKPINFDEVLKLLRESLRKTETATGS